MGTRTAILLAASCLWLGSACFGEGAGRERGRDGEPENPVKSVYGPPPAEEPSYQATQRTRDLRRHAVNSFHRGLYAASEEAFSLAYKRYRKDRGTLLDYALCSILYPKAQQSLHRVSELLKEEEGLSGGKSGRSLFIEGLMLWEKGELDKAKECLAKAEKEGFGPAGLMLERAEEGKTRLLGATDPLVKKLLPPRRSSMRRMREKNA